MSEKEIEVCARILLALGEIGDVRRRIAVAAAAIKIGIIQNPGEDRWVDQIREVAGCTGELSARLTYALLSDVQ